MSSNNEYAKWVNLAASIATALALILVVIKLYAWIVTDSSAILATATDSVLDLFASLMNVIIIRFALKPADDKHKFGHGKAESLAGLVQSAFVLGSAMLLVFTGIDRTVNPVAITQSSVGIIVIIFTIFATLALVLFQQWVVKKTGSVAISADALHYRSDLLLNIGVLVALFLSQGIWLKADGVFTALVGFYLAFSALKIVWMSVQHLMDHELPEEEVKQVEQIVFQHDETRGLHELKTRQAGYIKFIQFHLELADELTLFRAHQISEEVEQDIINAFLPTEVEVLIHLDPESVVKAN